MTYVLIDPKREGKKQLPAAGHSHCFWDDISKCNTLPHELTPTQPGERRRSPGPTADPEGQRLRKKEKKKFIRG